MPAQPQHFDILRVFVAKDIARTVSAGDVASPSTLANGEVVITDLGLNVLDTTTVLAQEDIMIVQGRGSSKGLLTMKVSVSDLAGYKGKAFEDKVEQVTYLGYDATTNTGAFEAINDNFYQIRTYLNDQTPSPSNGLYMPISADYTSDSSATEPEVVDGLYVSLTNKLAYWTQKQVLAERVSSAAGAATTDTVNLYQGSNVVTGATNIAGAASVGDYIRVGSQSTDTDEVYKITAISGTTLTLDTAFQNADVNVAIYRVTAANVLAGDMGIRLTGVARTFALDSRPYSLVSFQTSLVDCGTTPQNTPTKAFMGVGTYEQVATMENASWGSVGQIFNYKVFPPYARQIDAVEDQDYSTLMLNWSKVVGETTRTKMGGQIMIACALDGNVASTFDTNIDGAATSVVDVLDAWATSFTNFTAQGANL